MADTPNISPTEGMTPEERTKHWIGWMETNLEVIKSMPVPINMEAIAKDDVKDAASASAMIFIVIEAMYRTWGEKAMTLIRMAEMLDES